MSEPQLGPSPAQITLMGHNISAKIVAARARRRKRIRLAIGGAALATVLGITGAAVAVATAPPEVQAKGYTCFAADDPAGVFHVVPYPDDLPAPAPDQRVLAALEMCALGFSMNGIQAPHPTVCTLPDLRLGVFPNTRGLEAVEFCGSLGLPAAS